MGKIKLGIDFGTCYSCAAYLKDGNLMSVKDTSGGNYQSAIPSAVFIKQDGICLVGQGAINMMAQSPESFFHEFKRSLGSGHGYSCQGKRIEGWQLVAEVLKKIKNEAEKNAGTIEDVVLTVPASYNQTKKDVMLKAAKEAGFKNTELITEPVAAAIYWQRKNKESLHDGDITLVFDLGGGTFDTVLVKKQGDGFVFVGSPAGNDAIGGLTFDGKILDDLMAKSAAVKCFMEDTMTGIEQEARRLRFGQMLQEFCREFKHRLSEQDTWSDFLPFAFGGMERYTLTCSEFNEMTAPYIEKTVNICDAVVKSAGISWSQVGRILLVGGSTRIPYVQEALERRFGRPVCRCDEPDMAVGYGAALIETKEENVELFAIKVGELYGYQDANGNMVIPPQFPYAEEFEGEFALVGTKEYGYGYGDYYYCFFIDKKGNEALTEFETIKRVYEGLARFNQQSKWGYIDKTGKVVIKPIFDFADDFKYGLAAVQINEKWGYIDRNGSIAIPLQFAHAEEFRGEFALVQTQKYGDYFFIDKNGNKALTELGIFKGFYEGLARFKPYSDQWGYIDKTGKVVIKPIFDFADDFSSWEHKLAAVQINGKWGFIDRNGSIAIPLQFECTSSTSSGLYVKTNAKWYKIDSEGNILDE